MTITILISGLSGLFVFLGQLLGWFISEEPRLIGWSVFFYVFAVVSGLCAVVEFIYSIARFIARRKLAGGGHRRRRRRR